MKKIPKKESDKLTIIGMLQAFGLVIYCSFIGYLMLNGNFIFGKTANFIGPVFFLLLFIVSALICVLIAFYTPYVLFFEQNKKKQAVQLIINTTGWLVLLTFGVLGYIIYKRFN